MNTRTPCSKFNTLGEAEAYLQSTYAHLEHSQFVPVRTVDQVLENPTEAAVIRSPVIRYSDAACEECSRTAKDLATLAQHFEWQAEETTRHYEDTAFVKQCYPKGVLEVDSYTYYDLVEPHCVRAPNVVHDPQLYFTTGKAFTGWHFDASPNVLPVFSQLQQGRKLWWLATNRRSSRSLQGRKTPHSLLEWADEVSSRFPADVVWWIQEVDDVIYVPWGVAHQVWSLEQTSMITFNSLPPQDELDVINAKSQKFMCRTDNEKQVGRH